MSASRASKSRPYSTPRRCQPVRLAPATNCPSRRVVVGDDLALESDRPERAGVGAERRRGSRPPSTGGRRSRARPRASPPRAGRRPGRARARPSRRAFVTGIAFDVAAGSMPRKLGEVVDRCDPRGRHLERLVELLGERGRPRHAAGDLEIRGVVPVLAGDERVLTRSRRRQVVDRLGPSHHPRLRLHLVVLDLAAVEHPPYAPACFWKLTSRPSSSRSKL